MSPTLKMRDRAGQYVFEADEGRVEVMLFTSSWLRLAANAEKAVASVERAALLRVHYGDSAPLQALMFDATEERMEALCRAGGSLDKRLRAIVLEAHVLGTK